MEVVTASEYGSALTRCLQLNALALAFSLTHVIGDYAILTARAGGDALAIPWYLALAGAAYGWWGWSLARAAGDGRSGLFSLLVLSLVWAAALNGGSLVFTSLSILLADVIHFGSLLFGISAAYATWRVLRAKRVGPVTVTEAHV
jgi:hypothetical protein